MIETALIIKLYFLIGVLWFIFDIYMSIICLKHLDKFDMQEKIKIMEIAIFDYKYFPWVLLFKMLFWPLIVIFLIFFNK